MEPSWEFKATVFELDNLDFTFFGGTENRAPIEREHTAYNYFVKTAIEAALRYSSLISEATDIEIIIDEKTRTANDNFSHYLERTFKRNYPDANIIIRDCPSEDERLIQACDIMSGARNTILVKMAGLTKQTAAVRVWLPRCKSYLFPLKPKK